MIVCHCQRIADRDIHAAMDWMRAADPETLITPGKVYRVLGKAPNCGGCMPLFLGVMLTSSKLEIPADLRRKGGFRQEMESCKATKKSLNT